MRASMNNSPRPVTVTLRERKSFQDRVRKIALYLVLSAIGAFFILPFYWAFMASFKSLTEMYQFPPRLTFSHLQWQNYVAALTVLPFHRFLANTLLIILFKVAGTVVSCTLVGFAFARLQFRGRNFLFYALISTMMLPEAARMIPDYQIMQLFGWIDTYKPLVVPSFLAVNVFNVFLMRQYFRTIPKSLDEAAKIDGCSSARIFLEIMVPLAKPAILTIGVFSFIAGWQDFADPLIYLQTFSKFTISLGLKMFQDAEGGTFGNLLMAASMVAMVPILVIFFVAQRYFIKGIVISGGSKG
jgi:ABC-type glycerol-3-phosphate transport system permease component